MRFRAHVGKSGNSTSNCCALYKSCLYERDKDCIIVNTVLSHKSCIKFKEHNERKHSCKSWKGKINIKNMII